MNECECEGFLPCLVLYDFFSILSFTVLFPSDKTFTVSGYSEEVEETLTEMVEDGGGQVVPLSHPGTVHYCLVTPNGQCHPKTEEVVSHFFLEDCINAKVSLLSCLCLLG